MSSANLYNNKSLYVNNFLLHNYTQPLKFTDRFLAKLLLYCVIWLKSTALAKAYRNERDIHVKERLLLILRGYHL